MSTLEEITSSCKVTNMKGLHARAAAQIVSISNNFECDMTIAHKAKTVSSLSLIKLLTLDAPRGSILNIRAHGPDAKKACDAISKLVLEGFGE
ncbi:MAG: HPr family phosphocarrier protein [Kangiellaceae bacterium]|nr:HPr family phosphocarrier protein [Kangiellaceae bacterium]